MTILAADEIPCRDKRLFSLTTGDSSEVVVQTTQVPQYCDANKSIVVQSRRPSSSAASVMTQRRRLASLPGPIESLGRNRESTWDPLNASMPLAS